MKNSFKHIWFDFSGTLTKINEQKRAELSSKTYSEVVKKEIYPALTQEFENLEKQHKSTSAAFHSLGLPADFWAKTVNNANFTEIYQIAQPNLVEILNQIKQKILISLFANIDPGLILHHIGIDEKIFKYILKAGDFEKPKPFLDGFVKILGLSGCKPEEILYVGDVVENDVLPAKSLGIKTGLMWEKSSEADFCFSKFEDILAVI